MVINELLTKRNFKKGVNKVNKFIVVHYVGATGDAKNNCLYFEKVYRGASAHYFIGHKGDKWRCVKDEDVAWHCGALRYKHKECRNSNSIGVELCCRKKNGKWYFEDATINSAVELIKELMKKYNIPLENVIRHYDVTGKRCPEPFVRDGVAWQVFKALLRESGEVFQSYRVKVTATALNIRAGAGTGFKITGTIRNQGVYTIVEEKNGWGKLKSGMGWICLSYTKRV